MSLRVVAVIPARAGSKGVPKKNLKSFAGLPLIAHSLKCAALCPSISRVVVSTDGEEIAATARRFGADVPFLRPAELADDHVGMWPVLQHALTSIEELEGNRYDVLVLLDPTSPTRLPEDVERVVAALEGRPEADLALTVSEPHFSPYWHMMITGADGFGQPLLPGARQIERRQDCPPSFFINGLAYAYRTTFLREQASWANGKFLMVPTPETRAISIDTAEEFEWADRLVSSALIQLPWLNGEGHD